MITTPQMLIMVFGKVGDEAALVPNKLNFDTQKYTDLAEKKSVKLTDKTFGENIIINVDQINITDN